VEEQMHNVDYDPGPQLETKIKIASTKDPGFLSQIPDPDF
jgi:hypothetical protein